VNFNTFTSYIGGTARNQILSQTLAATTETEFKVATDNGSGAIAVLSIPTGTGIGGSSDPQGPDVNQAIKWQSGRQTLPFGSPRPGHNSGSFDLGRGFGVRLTGVATPASNAANTLALKIYCGTSKSGSLIASTGALTGTESSTTPAEFIVEAQMFWGSGSQQISGQYWYNLNTGTPGYHVWQAIATPVTSIALTGLNFCATATWGNAVGGVVAVSEFSLYQM